MRKKVKHLVLITLFPLIVYFLVGCGEKVITIDDSNNPSGFKVGDKFAIILESNGSTGYQWELSAPLDENILILVSHEYKVLSEMPGSSGEETWTFEAVGTGTIEIILQYRQPWVEQPTETKTYTITIQ